MEELPGTEVEEALVVEMPGPLWKRLLPYAAAVLVAVSCFLFWLSGSGEKPHKEVAQQLNKKIVQPVPVVPAVKYTEYYNQKSG